MVTLALVWTRQMRPALFPKFLGKDFFLAGYRIFTRLHDDSGQHLRGLKILRSETNKNQMVWMGNLLTQYNYQLVKVSLEEDDQGLRLKTWKPNGARALTIKLDTTSPVDKLPDTSPFPDWKTARKYAGPMPYTFSPEKDGNFVVIRGSRNTWDPRPIHVEDWQIALFDEAPFCDAKPLLANAFIVENVDYRWDKGRILKAKMDL